MRNTNRWMATLLLLATACGLAAQNRLNMFIESNRFLDGAGNTVMHIDYQVPYRNLMFLAHKGGYFAELKINVSMTRDDSLVVVRDLTDNVGISNKDDAVSDKTYLNRLSFLLDSQVRKLIFTALDVNSQRSFSWEFEASPLTGQDIFSDIQLCSEVLADSSSYLRSFHRGAILYKTEPSLIFDKTMVPEVFLYLEIYPASELIGQSQLLTLYLEKDSLMVRDDYIDFTPGSATEGITLKIPLEDLKPGKYIGNLAMQLGEAYLEREFEFFVTESVEQQYAILTDPEEEIVLLRYFSGNQVPSDWARYDDSVKQRYISSIWKRMASTGRIRPEDLLSSVRERVDYANRNFKYFKDGWKTDMGRIYIRNGKPDEVEKDTTMDDTRYVRKDYQIWKYRGRLNAVYAFVDMQMNGNYQLVYVNNDDMERSNPDYLRYLGDDFDTSKLGD